MVIRMSESSYISHQCHFSEVGLSGRPKLNTDLYAFHPALGRLPARSLRGLHAYLTIIANECKPHRKVNDFTVFGLDGEGGKLAASDQRGIEEI